MIKFMYGHGVIPPKGLYIVVNYFSS